MMETGIDLIRKEREEQLIKHKRTVQDDAYYNDTRELAVGARLMIKIHPGSKRPRGWNITIWKHMINKPYRDRLIIAGALIAAEIDRLNYIEEH